jgi:hypothetical protein
MINRISLLRSLILTATTLVLSALVAPNQVKGQGVSVSASIDSTLMVIGGQMNLTLSVTQPAGLAVSFPMFTDTITKNIDVVELGKPDTTFQNNNLLNISQVYRITSFDSGLHYIPPIEFQYMEAEMARAQNTNALALMVVNPFQSVDPEKGMFDIKKPINTPFSFAELLKYMHWVVAFMLFSSLLVLGIYWWLKKKNPIKGLIFKEKPADPPHVIALRELERIKNEKPWQKGQVKFFYSELTDVLRIYMENRFSFPAMEQTSHEILRSLKAVDLPDEKLLPKMKKILETADLAKFAKYEPLPDENDLCLLSSFFFVNQTKLEEIKSTEEAVKESLEREKAESLQH